MKDRPRFRFFAGYDPAMLHWGFVLLIDPDLRLGEPGEQALSTLRIECWRVPWRRRADPKKRWRIITVHRLMWVVRSDWPEIKRRRRARFGWAFA